MDSLSYLFFKKFFELCNLNKQYFYVLNVFSVYEFEILIKYRITLKYKNFDKYIIVLCYKFISFLLKLMKVKYNILYNIVK